MTTGTFLVDYESNIEVSVINESGNSKYGVYFDYVELWPLEGPERLKNVSIGARSLPLLQQCCCHCCVRAYPWSFAISLDVTVMASHHI